MSRLTLFLKPGLNRIVLESSIATTSSSKMLVKNVSIFWDSVNIVTGLNETIEHTEAITFPQSYWTFNMLKSYVQKFGVIMVANTWDNTCSVQAIGHDVNLKKFGVLLGFPENQDIVAGSWQTSPKQVEINKSLRFVTVSCNIVNTMKNFDTHEKRSDIICTLPITSQQTLNGTVTPYGDRRCNVPLNNGVFSEIFFSVTDNVFHQSGMKILPEVEISN